MGFLSLYQSKMQTLTEADESAVAGAAPEEAPGTGTPPVGPQNPGPAAAPAPTEPAKVLPEGYVELIRLLAKALVMQIPSDAIDELFQQEITSESANIIKNGLQDVIDQNSSYKDNPERLENPNFIAFTESINEKNFTKKLTDLVKGMKKYSKDIDFNV